MAQKLHTPSTFNELHSNFVTTEDGTTLRELLEVLGSISLTPILVPFLLPWIVPPSFVQQAVFSSDFFALIRAILEYPFLIVLPVWIVTIFVGESAEDGGVGLTSVVFITLASIPLCILIVNYSITAPKWLGFKEHWQKLKVLSTGWTRPKEEKDGGAQSSAPTKYTTKLPFITNYRAIVIYITVLAILAIDFPIFPRRFAKTKAYGISLMDVGTGCFVFANGIVAPEARNRVSPLAKSAKSTVPIVILGFIRLITVKGIEYQEVVEEYGVHWNFFFTLASIKVLSSLLFSYFDASQSLKIATLLGIFYEALLKTNDFENEYVLNENVSRSANLLNANREGIFSVFGYLVIYIASIYFGKIIYLKTRVSVAEWSDYAFQTFLQVAILWTCYALSTRFGSLPCRRSANLSYILLMVALNYSLLWFQMFLSLLQVSLQHYGLIYGPMLFYELHALQKKGQERLQYLQKMTKDFAQLKRRKEDEKMMKKEVDDKLEILEEAVELLKKQQKEGRIAPDTIKKIMKIEDEIEELERKLQQADFQEARIAETAEKSRNLVLLPDLSRAPIILESICYNGLVVFLLGNLLTGLINCAIYTMYTPSYIALCYLWMYSTVIAAFSVTLYWYELQLKFW